MVEGLISMHHASEFKSQVGVGGLTPSQILLAVIQNEYLLCVSCGDLNENNP